MLRTSDNEPHLLIRLTLSLPALPAPSPAPRSVPRPAANAHPQKLAALAADPHSDHVHQSRIVPGQLVHERLDLGQRVVRVVEDGGGWRRGPVAVCRGRVFGVGRGIRCRYLNRMGGVCNTEQAVVAR